MKKYYTLQGEHANTYLLFYVETLADKRAFAEHLSKAERISYQEAVKLAREERRRREENPQFGGYASALILPAEYWDMHEQMALAYLDKKGYVLCRPRVKK